MTAVARRRRSGLAATARTCAHTIAAATPRATAPSGMPTAASGMRSKYQAAPTPTTMTMSSKGRIQLSQGLSMALLLRAGQGVG